MRGMLTANSGLTALAPLAVVLGDVVIFATSPLLIPLVPHICKTVISLFFGRAGSGNRNIDHSSLLNTSHLKFMKSTTTAAVLLAALVLPAVAATVNTGPIQTLFEVVSIPPRVTSISESTVVTVDLSSISGLTPGSGIEITFTTANELLWLGEFGAGDGDLTLSYHGRFTVSAGAFSTFTDTTWFLGPVPFESGQSSGYSFGPVPPTFSLSVPWGTDLSAVSITLTDFFSLTGNDPYILSSELQLPAATLTTSSVPEPATVVLTMSACGLLLNRRRNA